MCRGCRREFLCQWKYKLCWGWKRWQNPETIHLSTDVRIPFYSLGNRGQQEVPEECLTMLCPCRFTWTVSGPPVWVRGAALGSWPSSTAPPELPPSKPRPTSSCGALTGTATEGSWWQVKPWFMLWGLCVLGVCPCACPLLELFIPNPAISSVIRKLITRRASLGHRARGNLALVSKTMPVLNWAESLIRLQ